MDDLVLASGSPRRRDLLALLGVPFRVVVPDVDETPGHEEPPAALVARLAAAKAVAGAARDDVDDDAVVIAADTVVDVDGEVFGKPLDHGDAARMLSVLSGRTHLVHTGLAVRRGPETTVEVVTTAVRMAALAPAEVSWYVATGEPSDKAGAYAIQGIGGQYVAAIDGSPSNVVGLPLDAVGRLLRIRR